MSIQPRYPTAYLKSAITGRFHPIIFRPSPRPSDDGDVCRFRSSGHHTVGFDTETEAKVFVSEQPNWKEVALVFEWDGVEIPATTLDFSQKEYGFI